MYEEHAEKDRRSNQAYASYDSLYPMVKCGLADLRMLKRVKCGAELQVFEL